MDQLPRNVEIALRSLHWLMENKHSDGDDGPDWETMHFTRGGGGFHMSQLMEPGFTPAT